VSDDFQRSYGLTLHPFACRKPEGDTFLLGGEGENMMRWTRVLTPRAVKILWFQLGAELFPEQFQEKTSGIGTLPVRSIRQPSITSDLHLDKTPEGEYEIIGRSGSVSWSARLAGESAQQLWTVLDHLLYE